MYLRCTRGAIMVHSCVNVLIGTLVLHTFGRRESSAPILPFKYTPVPCCPRETFSWVYIFLLIFGRRWSTATTTLVESTRVPCYSVWTFLWGTFIFVSTRNMIMESVHQDGNMIAQRCHNECTESAPRLSQRSWRSTKILWIWKNFCPDQIIFSPDQTFFFGEKFKNWGACQTHNFELELQIEVQFLDFLGVKNNNFKLLIVFLWQFYVSFLKFKTKTCIKTRRNLKMDTKWA